MEFARAGLPVVIVNPTAPVGDHDVKPTPTGKIVLDFLNGDMPAFIDTGLNVVDVRDTAEGHWLACERGRPGERYILGSENLTLAQISEKLGADHRRSALESASPYLVAYCAGACSTAWAGVSGKPPRVPLDAVRMAKKKMWVTHDKAARELGFSPAPAEQALSRAVEWFRGGFRGGAGPRPANLFPNRMMKMSVRLESDGRFCGPACQAAVDSGSPVVGTWINGGADPPVRSRRPPSACSYRARYGNAVVAAAGRGRPAQTGPAHQGRPDWQLWQSIMALVPDREIRCYRKPAR